MRPGTLPAAAICLLLAAAPLAGKAPPAGPGRKPARLAIDAHKAHYLAPGQSVDVLATALEAAGAGRGEWQTQTLLQDVRLLEIAPPSSKNPRAELKLALTKDEAELLEYARARKSVFTVIVRGAKDRDTLPLEPAAYSKLFR